MIDHVGLGIGPAGKPLLWLSEYSVKPAHLHLAFTASSRREVEAFHGAFVIGPDGHNVEAACHTPEA